MTAPRLLLPLLAITIPLPGCAVEATDNLGVVTDDGERVIADVAHPTPDGAAAYRFTFVEAEGAIATLVTVPSGYPDPVLTDDCPLDTFLRVAPGDATVPVELLRACADDAADLGRARRVDELRLPTHELELSAATPEDTGGLCTKSRFDQRFAALRDECAYLPPTVDCDLVCDLRVTWDGFGCVFTDDDTGFLDYCSDTDYAFLLSTYGPDGTICYESHLDCQPGGPNHACDHGWAANPDWGPWVVWDWFQTGANTTKFLVDISICGVGTTVNGYWQVRNKTTDAWGAQHGFSVFGDDRFFVVLYAGTSSGKYRGVDFHVHLTGANMYIMSGSVQMKGLDAATCPIHI